MISERIGNVAYRLDLPLNCCLHIVFHVSLLKHFKGDFVVGGDLLKDVADGHLVQQPLLICDALSVLKEGKLAPLVLVQWENNHPENSTWEWLDEFQKVYHDFHLNDNMVFKESGSVMPEFGELEKVDRA